MEKEQIESSETFGFCQLDAQSKVVFQNKTSKKICGEKTDTECTTCLDTLNPKSLASEEGLFSSKKMVINDTICDASLIKEKESATVILYPKSTAMERKLYLNQFELTSREREIAELLLEGKSNAEIMTLLFISKATLKTHVNTLYKKVPTLKTKRTT